MVSTSRKKENKEIWHQFRWHSRTFSLAALLLPKRLRLPVAILYLYCRQIDSIADERVLDIGVQSAREEILAAKDSLTRTLSGSPPPEMLWQRLAEVHENFVLPSDPMLELIEGALWDLDGRSVLDKTDFEHYCELVGGSVGEMMLPFFVGNYRSNIDLIRKARFLGNAMQATNICRDVGQDLCELNRIYLPTTWIDENCVSVDKIRSGIVDRQYSNLLERVMKCAEMWYLSGSSGLEYLPFGACKAIQSALRMYREILNEIRANGYENLHNRAYVTNLRKLSLLFHDSYESRKTLIISSSVKA